MVRNILLGGGGVSSVSFGNFKAFINSLKDSVSLSTKVDNSVLISPNLSNLTLNSSLVLSSKASNFFFPKLK